MCLYLSALKIIVGLYEVKKNPFNCFMLTNVIRALVIIIVSALENSLLIITKHAPGCW